MEIELGLIIKVICSNGVIESGKLIEHNEKQMVLELIDKSLFIIQDPFKNVIVIKTSPQQVVSSVSNVLVEAEPEPDRYYRQEELRAKNLAELHKLKAAEERKRAHELLINFKKSETLPEVKFGFPNFTKSVSKHPKKKTK